MTQEQDFSRQWGYADEVIRRYTLPEGTVDNYNAFVKSLNRDQIHEITELYREVARRGDMWSMSAWVHAQAPRPRAFELFKLFNALARNGVAPFTTREVEYSLPPERLDWTKLPPEFEYLREPAMKYGVYQFQQERDQLKEEITDVEIAELSELAERVRSPGELERIWEWRVQHEGEPEEELVQWLIQVIQESIPRIPKDPASLDWSKLPNELKYLKGPASKYGIYWLGVDRERLGQRMPDSELTNPTTLVPLNPRQIG